MEKVLITGINGFLGSHLAMNLARKFNVIGLEYSLENLFRIKNLNLKVYSSTQENLKDIFSQERIDYVIHTATVYEDESNGYESIINTNIVLPVKLYRLSEKYGVKAFINTDTFFNSPDYKYSYLNQYTLSKRHCIEWLLSLNGQTKLINMNLFHLYGPNDSLKKFVPQILLDLKKNKPKIELTPGEQKRDFIYVEDVVNAYNCVISNINKIDNNFTEFQVGTGNAISLKEFIHTAASVIGSKSCLAFGAINYREGEIMFSKADTSTLNDIGWLPKFSLPEGIYETISKQ